MLFSLNRASSSPGRPTKQEHVVHADGRVVKISEIVLATSSDLYQTDTHYDICRALSQHHAVDEVSRKIIENVYTLKSRRAREASALTAYLAEYGTSVQKVRVAADLIALLEPRHRAAKITFSRRGRTPPYITLSPLVILLAKSILHRLFRVLSRPARPNHVIVRGWVEVTTQMYRHEMSIGLLRVYPFALSLSRQFRFVMWCRRNRIDFALSGLPYSPLAVLRLFISRRPRELGLAHIERAANERHAAEILSCAPKEMYTSDEFEVASFVLYRPLIEAGVRVVNTAHGVGQYCPHVSYSEFRVFGSVQEQFYRKYNPTIRFSERGTPNRILSGIPYTEAGDKPLAVVFIHQNFEGAALPAEAHAQDSITSELRALCSRMGLPFLIKLHPNQKTRRGDVLPDGAVRNWEAVFRWRPIFVTISSTAFFDTRGIGPMLVYQARTFQPALYFPRPFLGVTVESAERVVARLSVPNVWVRAASLHALDGKYPADCALADLLC